MERLQEPINHYLLGEHLDVGYLEQEVATTNSLRFSVSPELEERMPFLQMLQSVDYPPQLMPFKDANFQTFLRLQHLKKPWELGNVYMPEMENQFHGMEFESCITHDIVESHSPVKCEARYFEHPQHSITSAPEVLSCESKQEHLSTAENKASKQTNYLKSPPAPRERRKRKRTRPNKNKEEVESQRMTHIAVERNRRRLMNDHLNVLKSLMPTSYIQRGDQASIVGGAIDFVKGLEQLLKSLECQKKMRRSEGNNDGDNSVSSSSSCGLATIPTNGLFMSRSQCKIGGDEENCNNIGNEQLTAQKNSKIAGIEVTVIQSHVNLKIHCLRRHGQLLKVIVAFEELRLTILHLSITSSEHTVFYSFNLKIEGGCKLTSADEIAGAVHRMLN